MFFEQPLIDCKSSDVFRWSFEVENSTAAHRARSELGAALCARGIVAEQLFAAEMVYSELVGNVVRHARGSIDVVLDMTGPAAVLHAMDRGSGFFINPKLPADAYEERGRGLYIVAKLARDFSVTPRTQGPGSRARAVLHGRLQRAAHPVELRDSA